MQIVARDQQRAARAAGGLYLTTMATAVFSEMAVKDRLVVPGDAVATARSIADSETLFRLALACDLATLAGVVVLAWALHEVLAPAGPRVARLGLCLRLVESAVAGTCLVFGLFALRPLGEAPYLRAFDPQQLAVLTRLHLGASAGGLSVAFVLLGLGSATFAWAWLRSGYIPRALAALGLFGSVLLAGGAFWAIVFPALGEALGLWYMLPLGFFEIVLGAWLLVRGVRLGSRRSA